VYIVAIVGTQFWDKEAFKEVYPRAYMIHELVNRPDNVKRFIIGRQFCTVLVVFLIAQVSTFPEWSDEGYDPILFWIIVKSGLVGVFIVLSFGQLMPELLAAEFPLRFMNLMGSFSVLWASLLFDKCGVGHCAWAVYYTIRHYFLDGDHRNTEDSERPAIIKALSAELLDATGCAYGSPTATKGPAQV
jgi:hypothetical protein